MKIIYQEPVKFHKRKKPGFMGEGGCLILTEDRLLFSKSPVYTGKKAAPPDTQLEKLHREGKVKLEIPFSSIIEAGADSLMLCPYLMVRCRTPMGEEVYSFIHSEPAALMSFTPWVEEIYRRMREFRKEETLGREAGELKRSIVIVDQSHDQEGQTRNLRMATTVNGICSQLNLTAPIALRGSPNNELFVANQHLLPKTLLIILFGMKEGKFQREELELIYDYVRNGGQLILTAYSPYDPPNTFVEPFGAKFLKGVIEDEVNNDGQHKDHIIVRNLADHPVNAGVNAISFGQYGCYPIEASRGAIVLASSSINAKPPNSPVAALIPYGSGQAIITGQTSLFQDNFINNLDNERWLRNIITSFASQRIPTYLPPPPPPPPPGF